jgi:hypothetical protein
LARHGACDPPDEGRHRPISGQEAPLRNALVPLVSTDRDNAVLRAGGRLNADFIAHLIATSLKAPQTCSRRRAEPAVASAAYRALGQWPTPPGRAVSRSL